MIDVDYAEAKRVMIKQAAGKSDGYKYQKVMGSMSCMYSHPDEDGNYTIKGCIVGSAAIDEEWCDFKFFDQFPEVNTCSLNASVANTLCMVLEKAGKVRFTQKATHFMRCVQKMQDGDDSWAYAVVRSINEYDDIKYLSDSFPAE